VDVTRYLVALTGTALVFAVTLAAAGLAWMLATDPAGVATAATAESVAAAIRVLIERLIALAW
jgi:hypothetical protein